MNLNRARTVVLAMLAALLLIIGLTSPSIADDKSDLNKKKDSLTGKIKDAKEDADHSSKQLAKARKALNAAKAALDSAQAELGRTKGQLAVAQAQDEAMQARLVKVEGALDTAVAQLSAGQSDLKDAEAAVAAFTVQSLQNGDDGMRAFNRLLSGESPEAFTEQMTINGSVSEAQVAKMQELDASRLILKLKRDEVRKLRDVAKKARAEAAANLKRQKELKAQAEAQTAEVGELVAARESAKKSANAALQEDLALLRELENDRARVERELAALADKDLADGGAGVGGDGGGTLSRPVGGPITSSYGMRRHPITHVYKLHDGTDFGASCGTPIRAAASGTIIQQYYNGGYGNRVILNNGIMRGKSVVTAYNHLSRYARSTGSKVSRGDVIGYVGTTGYSTGCHLHFMVIVNGRTTNPMGWL